MSNKQDRGLKFVYFLLGLAVPLVGLAVWCSGPNRKKEIDQAHDITVEDSFPASDPPSAW